MSEADIYVEVARTTNVLATAPDTNTNWLSDSEESRLASINLKARREHYLAGHWLSRVLLARGFGGEPLHWKLLEQKNNPPQVLGQLGKLRVSISHSQNWVAVAVANVDIGIDLEQRPRRLEGSIERVLLNKDESPSQIGADELLQRWVAKEAWLKRRCESALPERLRRLQIQTAKSFADVQMHCSEEWYLGIAAAEHAKFDQRSEVIMVPGPRFTIFDL